MKFTQIKDNEWFAPTMKNHLMKCCDCGLIHVMNFKIEGKQVLIKAKRKAERQKTMGYRFVEALIDRAKKLRKGAADE